ncbi:MAG: hypothetical protein GF419_09055 [Ignavibacteriales bacterium]|nr:hypothetical protein [Ignavibacteriales bacterium]
MKLGGLHIAATALVALMLALNGSTLVKHYCERHGARTAAFFSSDDCMCEHSESRADHGCAEGACSTTHTDDEVTIGGPACCANEFVSIALEPFVKDEAPKPSVVLDPLFAVVVVSEIDDDRPSDCRAADRAPPRIRGKEFLIFTHALKIPPEIA